MCLVPLQDCTVSTKIHYIARTARQPRVWYCDPPAGEPVSTLEVDARAVAVRNVRGRHRDFTLERDGCAFLDHAWPEFDPGDDARVRAELYPAAEALARRITGIDRVLAFDHGVRRAENGLDSAPKLRRGGAARNVADFVHNDYIPYSAALRVRWFAGDEAERLLRHRFSIFNFWWPLAGPLHDHPLALCVNGAKPEHFIPIENMFERGPNPIAGFTWAPGHEWIYLAGMVPGEMMVFRTWDSWRALSGVVPHGAFREPTEVPGTPPRASMELRVLAFHDG